jgi:hypothetical protein
VKLLAFHGESVTADIQTLEIDKTTQMLSSFSLAHESGWTPSFNANSCQFYLLKDPINRNFQLHLVHVADIHAVSYRAA